MNYFRYGQAGSWKNIDCTQIAGITIKETSLIIGYK